MLNCIKLCNFQCENLIFKYKVRQNVNTWYFYSTLDAYPTPFALQKVVKQKYHNFEIVKKKKNKYFYSSYIYMYIFFFVSEYT